MCEPNRTNGSGTSTEADHAASNIRHSSIWNLFPVERGKTPSGKNERRR